MCVCACACARANEIHSSAMYECSMNLKKNFQILTIDLKSKIQINKKGTMYQYRIVTSR
jgi:hypothetical protein